MYFCAVLYIVCFVPFCVFFVCICVLNYCHRVVTQLQLNISYHIIVLLRKYEVLPTALHDGTQLHCSKLGTRQECLVNTTPMF